MQRNALHIKVRQECDGISEITKNGYKIIGENKQAHTHLHKTAP